MTRPTTLIHWTGHKYEIIQNVDTRRREYVALLKLILEKGLKYSRRANSEIIIGGNGASLIQVIPMICFTELLPSEADRHTKRYGKLGICFRRELLMARGANPVFYIQNANQGVANTNLAVIASHINEIQGLNVFLAFIQPMSDPYSNNLCYYEEFEWRMVLSTYRGKHLEYVVEREPDTFYCTFAPTDVSRIVFPDTETRILAKTDSFLLEYFERSGATLVTLEECKTM